MRNRNAVTLTCFPFPICKNIAFNENTIYLPFNVCMYVTIEAKKSIVLYVSFIVD